MEAAAWVAERLVRLLRHERERRGMVGDAGIELMAIADGRLSTSASRKHLVRIATPGLAYGGASLTPVQALKTASLLVSRQWPWRLRHRYSAERLSLSTTTKRPFSPTAGAPAEPVSALPGNREKYRERRQNRPAPADRTGRLKVEPDLTVPGHPEIFAIGDSAIVARPDGRPVPGIAPAAKQEGAYVAAMIRARLRGQTPPPAFRYKHAGDPATIGKRRAVIDFGWIKLRGPLAWWLWGLAHIYFLIGVRNRLSVALNWLWIYARDQRSARLITQGGGRGGRPEQS